METSAEPPVGLGHAHVLVVDDELALATMVDAYLTRAGYRVTQAHTGPDAVDLARELGPDVVVLDLGLPELDGIEVRIPAESRDMQKR